MGAIIRAYDWHKTSLGPPEYWSQSLKTILRLLLSTGHPMLVWWGKDLIQFYNDAYSRSLGTERHPSALGQEGQKCWAEIWSDVEPQVKQVLSGNGHTWNENQLLRLTRNGKLEDVYWTYSYGPIDVPKADTGVGGILVVCTETTKQVLAEQSLKAAEARWRSLFDKAPSFMCILKGAKHRFEYANHNYLKLLGKQDILGKTLLEVLPEVKNQGFITLLDEVYLSGKTHQGVAAPLTFGSGESKYLDFIYQPILAEDGQVTGIMVQGSDVSDLVHTTNSLQEEDRRKDEFLAMLAHELRNPLAPISNASELLSQNTLSSSDLHNIGNILTRQVTQLTHLLDDLLDVSRISHKRISLKLEVLNLSESIKLAIESLQSAIEHKQHNVEFIDSEQPLYFNADMTRLMQCLANILSNAIKYTPQGGKITINLSTNDKMAEISIADNGTGISAKMQAKVFELFVQSTRTLDRSQGGLGIGLNIVKRLVKMHGGKVKVSSQGLGFGSTFCISLPIVDEPKQVSKHRPCTTNTKKRVLVVDDNQDATDTMCQLLTLLGHQTSKAYTAQQALELVDSFDPEIVLLDIGLPDMTGYQVAQEIIHSSKKQHRVLAALTGYGQAEDVLKAKQAGFNFHFTKPVSIDDLNKIFSFAWPE